MQKLACLSLAGLSGILAAQQADQPGAIPSAAQSTPAQIQRDPPSLPAEGQALRAADLLVPIHTQTADPVGGEYGWWAASGGYKASFHDGFVFYPYLGPDYPQNLPVRWTTESVTAGGQPLLLAGRTPRHSHTDWRYEYDHGTVVEAYDVLLEGVEQTFRIATRPAVAGEIQVVGSIATTMTAAPQKDEHAAIRFLDAQGKAHVVYGKAFALDATGKKTPIATSFDGTRITLTVPASVVASATFPLTIDPLTAPVVVSTWGGATFGLPSYPAIGRDDESTTKNIMVFYARQFSASDFDGYGRLCNNDFSNSGLVFTDVTTSWSTGKSGVASVAGANRWTLCLEREFAPATGSWIRVYVHDFLNTTLNSGPVLTPGNPSGTTRRWPDIGGTRSFSSGVNALCVFQQDTTSTQANTPNTDVWGMLVNASALTVGTAFRLDTVASGTTYDREYACVNSESSGGTASWVVGWQEYNNTITGDDWDILVARVSSTGVTTGSQGTVNWLGNSASTAHKKRPRIAGMNGRYMASFITGTSLTSDFGLDVETHRFDFLEAANTLVRKERRVAATSATADYVNGGIAFDTLTTSHWALVYQRGGYTTADLFAVRVGYTGGVTEAVTVYQQASTGGYSPGITFDDDSQRFLMCYGTTENPPSGYPVYGVQLTYPSTALNATYGTACGPGTISAGVPFSGNEFYYVRLTGAPASVPAILILGNGAAAVNLGFIGMPPCFLNTSPIVTTVASATNAAGTANLAIPIPDVPAASGNVYWQWAYGYPAAGWSLKVASTAGLRSQIR